MTRAKSTPALVARRHSNISTISTNTGLVSITLYWLGDRGQGHAFRRGTGGRPHPQMVRETPTLSCALPPHLRFLDQPGGAMVRRLKPTFGNRVLSDIDYNDVAEYRDDRLEAGASQKTVSLELGTLRALLRHHDLDATWAGIKKKIKLEKSRKIGRVISTDEEAALLRECRASRSRSLYVAVMLALQTCMRYSEIRLLQWRGIDLARRVITVGRTVSAGGGPGVGSSCPRRSCMPSLAW
jgi:hypothetical protein